MDFLRVQEVKGSDGSMANSSGFANEEYAKFGPEYGNLGRKREETFAWNLALRKRATMADHSDDSASSQPSKADFKKFWYQSEILSKLLKFSDCFLDMTGIYKSTSPVTFDDMLELYNQSSIYIGTKEFKSNFWDIQPMIRSWQPNWKRWQKAWRNCIKHYTPRTDPPKEDLELRGMIEKWNPKKRLESLSPPLLRCRKCLARKLVPCTNNATSLTTQHQR
jgi:hypothetical protein